MRVAAIPLPPHSGKDSILLLWFLRIVRGRALVVRLLLPGFLLHVGQLLQLFGRENGFNLRRRLVANLIDLCNLLLLGQRRVIARRIHLPGFICDNRAQFLSLLIRQIQRILVLPLRLCAILARISCRGSLTLRWSLRWRGCGSRGLGKCQADRHGQEKRCQSCSLIGLSHFAPFLTEWRNFRFSAMWPRRTLCRSRALRGT